MDIVTTNYNLLHMINKYTRIISFDVNYNIFTLGNCKIIILSLIKCGCIYKKKKKKDTKQLCIIPVLCSF